MARKTRAEAEQTRLDIINAALGLFHAKGYSRTTLQDIARQAGVTRGAIYWHFKDKVDLFSALKDEIEGSAGIRLEDLLQMPVDSLADIQDGLLRYFRQMEQEQRFRNYFETVFFRTEFTDELLPVREQYQDKLRRRQQKDEDDLRRLQIAGQVRADVDCVQAALALRALMIGLLHTWLMDSEAFSLTEQGGALLGDFFASLQPRT
jgi:TetR/AcrR family acrAB operon transcriptional repressor